METALDVDELCSPGNLVSQRKEKSGPMYDWEMTNSEHVYWSRQMITDNSGQAVREIGLGFDKSYRVCMWYVR